MAQIHKTFVFLIFFVLLAACSSSGRDRRPSQMNFQGGQVLKPGGLLFTGFDANNDYKVSREEFNSGIDLAFARADVDGSGQLSLYEYQDWAGLALGSKTALPAWIGMDRNGDNSIDQTEFRGEFTRLAEEYGLSSADGFVLAALTRDMGEVMADRMSNRPSMGRGRMPGGRTGGGRRR